MVRFSVDAQCYHTGCFSRQLRDGKLESLLPKVARSGELSLKPLASHRKCELSLPDCLVRGHSEVRELAQLPIGLCVKHCRLCRHLRLKHRLGVTIFCQTKGVISKQRLPLTILGTVHRSENQLILSGTQICGRQGDLKLVAAVNGGVEAKVSRVITKLAVEIEDSGMAIDFNLEIRNPRPIKQRGDDQPIDTSRCFVETELDRIRMRSASHLFVCRAWLEGRPVLRRGAMPDD